MYISSKLLLTIQIIVSTNNLNLIMALFCFDSGSSTSSGMVVNCSENELCYSEFYSVSKNPKTKRVSEWYVDRFCVHREQCLRRGIGPNRCVNLTRLDPVVQKTFKHKINEKHSANTHKRLVQSEFCCCQTDFCNRLDLPELQQKFNISAANSSPHQMNVKKLSILFYFTMFIVVFNN